MVTISCWAVYSLIQANMLFICVFCCVSCNIKSRWCRAPQLSIMNVAISQGTRVASILQGSKHRKFYRASVAPISPVNQWNINEYVQIWLFPLFKHCSRGFYIGLAVWTSYQILLLRGVRGASLSITEVWSLKFPFPDCAEITYRGIDVIVYRDTKLQARQCVCCCTQHGQLHE